MCSFNGVDSKWFRHFLFSRLAYKRSMMTGSPIQWLLAAAAFRSLPEHELRRLYTRCYAQDIPRGQTLTRKGHAPEALYIVLAGRFAVEGETEDAPGPERGPGAVFGETAFFARNAHAETVTAARDSAVLTLEWIEFQKLADRSPQLWQAVASALAKQLALPAAQPGAGRYDRPKTLAICHAGSQLIPPRFLERLAEALDRRADWQFLTSEAFGQSLAGGIALDDPQVMQWLAEQESRFDLIIRLADASMSEWTANAILHADEILLVGVHGAGSMAGAPVPLNPVEQFALETRGPRACRLTLIQERPPGAPRLTGARRWLEYRNVRSHHHVSLEDQQDYERFVRFLLGQAAGFIACSGGVFTAAHLGIFKAMRAIGIPVDCFGGTGGGAALTACLALGFDPDDAGALAMEILAASKPGALWSRPRHGLYDPGPFERLLAKRIPDIDIADLPLNYYALSADLAANKPVIHRQGSILEPMRANWLLPGLLPPLITDSGSLLVDGSLFDPVPIEPMRALSSGPNFIVEFALPGLGAAGGQETPSRGRMLLKMANPAAETAAVLPDFGSLLLRNLLLNRSCAASRAGPLDLLLSPPLLPGVGALDWEQHSRVQEAAYRWGVQELERLAGQNHPVITAALQAK